MIHRVVFNVQLPQTQPGGEAIATHERREAGVETGERLAGDRQQLAVAPQVLRPLLNLLARDVDGFVVVDGLERPQAFVADVYRFGREQGLAEMTLQTRQGAADRTGICMWD